jgi:hypothetical protein
MNLLSIDPGADFGSGLFVGMGKLEWAGFRELPDDCDVIDLLVIEDQEIRPPRGKKRVRPQDIVTLAQCAGRLAGHVHAREEVWVHAMHWMGGNGPPFQLHARILGALSPAERAVLDHTLKGVAKSLQHNVIEGVGIGLWKLQRLPR